MSTFFMISDTISSQSYEGDMIGSPAVERPIEGTTDVVTIDNNVSTYFSSKKRQWDIELPYLNQDEYISLKAFYDRQFTSYKYPLISIPIFGVDQTAVRMSINDTNVINDCGIITGLRLSFRESRQI